MIILKYLRKIINYLERKEFQELLKNLPIKVGNNVVFKKNPIIQLHPDAKLIIGNNATINSDNYGYHVNMHSPCKLMADISNAIIKIGDNTRFHGSCIHAYKRVEIGNNCLIAANCHIIDGNGHQASFDNIENRINTTGEVKEVVIEDNVWLGTGVVVLPGVTIGAGSIISANSVVHKDIPSMVIAGGNPIKIIKDLN
ncbi:acyltransferase [Lutibacter sp. A64]|uniref:acyltransferase n=1 Tax=Lutibacter sp. A64 TaxID=2918526 RepID=UPI001F0667DE|nr:acyltransferase [Lutibacter sp. A64]UMB55467.1 acyltransferase [Lutibacter sp. A64]